MFFQYACSDDSLLGQVCQRIGVDCTRLTKQVVDLSGPAQGNQVLGQIQLCQEQMCGYPSYVLSTRHCRTSTSTCHQPGKASEHKVKQKGKVVRRMVRVALPVIKVAIPNGRRVAVEWRQECQLWLLNELHLLQQRF